MSHILTHQPHPFPPSQVSYFNTRLYISIPTPTPSPTNQPTSQSPNPPARPKSSQSKYHHHHHDPYNRLSKNLPLHESKKPKGIKVSPQRMSKTRVHNYSSIYPSIYLSLPIIPIHTSSPKKRESFQASFKIEFRGFRTYLLNQPIKVENR